jgi:hypothetical protein
MPSRQPPADDIGALFLLPLGDFTRARDALAARSKVAGDTARATHIKSLAKPTLSAWVVNQVTSRDAGALAELLAAVAALRAAHSSGGDLRAAQESHRRSLHALTQSAAGILREAGGAATPEMMRRIAGTLEALVALGIPPGQLSRDLDPPGFEVLAASTLAPVGRPRGAAAPVLPFAPTAASEKRRQELERQREAVREAARRAAAAAETEANAAQQAAALAAQVAATSLVQVEEARLAKERLERELHEATATAAGLEAELRKLEREARIAGEAAKAAALRLQRAREQVGGETR